MFEKKEILAEFALEVAKEAIKLLKVSDNSDLPVILHVFSGAGCIMLERMEGLILFGKQIADMGMASEEAADLVFLGEAIKRGGEVFDSSPAYLDIFTGMKAVGAGVSNPFLRVLIQLFFLMVGLYHHFANLITGKMDRSEEHWSMLKNSDVANRQAYIYSTKDELTDCDRVKEMIRYRRNRPDAIITTKELTDSDHCSHLLSHPREYKTFVDEFLSSLSKGSDTDEKYDDIDPDFSGYDLAVD